MSAILFKEFLKMNRRSMGAANREKTANPKSPGAWLYPTAIEHDYFQMISNIQHRFLDPVELFIEENLQRWIEEYRADGVLPEDMKLDIFSSEFDDALTKAEADADDVYVKKSEVLLQALAAIGISVALFNQKQSQKFFAPLLGIPWVPAELWMGEVISVWAKTNYTLIKSLTTEGIKGMNLLVSEGVQFGKTYTEIMEEIRKKNKQITEPRSRLLARDQIGKLNGVLSQRRMQEAGIPFYLWATSQDEKVRGNPNGLYPKAIPSHYSINKKLCRWDNNAVYSIDGGKTWVPRTSAMPKAIPGQEIQCRCTGLPYFNDIIGEVDKEINEELAA